MMFLDNSSPSFSAQQLQLTEEEVEHDAKTFCLQAPSLIFEPFFTMSRDDQLGKAITHMKNTMARSEGVCNRVIANRLRLFATLLRVHGNQVFRELKIRRRRKSATVTMTVETC